VTTFYRDMPDDERKLLTLRVARRGTSTGSGYVWRLSSRSAVAPQLRYRAFRWQAGHGIAVTGVHPRPQGLVVVDVVYSSRPELADLVSLAVLVEAHRDERLRRHRGARTAERGCTHAGRPPRITTSVTSGRAIR